MKQWNNIYSVSKETVPKCNHPLCVVVLTTCRGTISNIMKTFEFKPPTISRGLAAQVNRGYAQFMARRGLTDDAQQHAFCFGKGFKGRSAKRKQELAEIDEYIRTLESDTI